jgi:hypothetical protein
MINLDIPGLRRRTASEKAAQRAQAEIDKAARRAQAEADKLARMADQAAQRAQVEAEKVGRAADDTGARLSTVELPRIDLAGTLRGARKAISDARRTLGDTGEQVAVRAEHAAHRASDVRRDVGRDVRHAVDDLRSLQITRRRRDPWPGVALVGGIIAGVAAMFLLDPVDGKRRRAMVRDKLGKWSRIAARGARGTAVDLRNRSQGMLHEARSAVNRTQPAAEPGPATVDLSAERERVGVMAEGTETEPGGYGEMAHETSRPNGRETAV